jgi:hypothetical protein
MGDMTHPQRWQFWIGCTMLMLGVSCTPALNWREVRFESSDISVLMPCKPDHASRPIALQAKGEAVPANLQLLGCEASDMQFTFGQINLPSELTAADAIQAWQQASLAPLNAPLSATTADAFTLRGALSSPQPVRRRLKTATHQVQWLWWARGNTMYQVALYGGLKTKTFDDTADVYFSGIKLP